jgi:hypothetical protein
MSIFRIVNPAPSGIRPDGYSDRAYASMQAASFVVPEDSYSNRGPETALEETGARRARRWFFLIACGPRRSRGQASSMVLHRNSQRGISAILSSAGRLVKLVAWKKEGREVPGCA